MHIVIVDSSRVVLRVVAGMLEPRGHVVTQFTDSAEALAYVTDNPKVRALITSLEVRPLGGLELCWSARLLAEANRPLSIIVMSSVRNARNLAEALDSGADDFIDKPPGAEELQARLRAAERLTTLQSELIRLADTDSLTSLLNRRAFVQRTREAAQRAGGFGQLAAILIDIDHFKRINDEYGHDVGDAAIRGIAALIADEGIAGRLGGEEFALVLPGRNLAEAESFAGRLRLKAADLRIRSLKGPVRLTCSFGVSEWSEGETVEGLLKRADIALYEAKTGGRNRVVSAMTDIVLARIA
ncbi:GGDEF domain-containing response regulator [Methylobacterium sp. Leaf118]|uniref:GGDEF domain-containing response regulator n=1 Tax=Methylobacterium sp. Leaf118 TaxID=2876562 RepID=UPI001E28E85B|nr:diguanylate cyclase [Methylobacterium sp. Leaf118]